MQQHPDILRIPRGDPKAAIRAFIIELGAPLVPALVLAIHFVDHGGRDPAWLDALLLLGGIACLLDVVRRIRAFFSAFDSHDPYVTMDRAGLACSLPTKRMLPWSRIEACACKNENHRTILRVFVKGTRQWQMDIDFALAAQPKRSLDQAMAACAAWIAATRDPSITESPIRDFVDTRRSLWLSTYRKPASKTFLVALLLTPIAIGTLVVLSRRPMEEPPMQVDGRPERRVLFLGNGRIAINDLPRMVRDIADTAHSPIRYDLHMRAWKAATLEQHWNDRGDQAALLKPWDLVVLQPQSTAFMDDDSARETVEFGTRLIQAAEAHGSHVALIANWGLAPRFFADDPDGDEAGARAYTATIGRDTRSLAGPLRAGVIDLDGAFADAEAAAPGIALTYDGNNPSHAGSYLAALVIYGYLSHADLAGIAWRPYDMDKPTAATLKTIAARHVR